MSENTSKRLAFFQKTVADGSQDPMAHYGLAMEYRSLGRHDEALAAFEALKKIKPDYVPMFLMCGQLLEQMSRPADAKGWYEAGLAAAQAARNTHAAGELEAAIAALG